MVSIQKYNNEINTNININQPKNTNKTNDLNNKLNINNENNNINLNNKVNINNKNNNVNTTGEVNSASNFNFNKNTGLSTTGGQLSLAGLNSRNTPTNNNNERVNLNSSNSINRFLNTYTQVDTERRNTNATSQCGAASIVASSMMAGGKDGMNTLVETVKRRGGLNQDQQQRVNEISNRIGRNEVTRGDIEFLQGVVYQQLNAIDVSRGYDTGEGVDLRSIREYCQTNCTPLRNPSIESMMRNSNIVILGMDTNGSSNSSEHFVVANQGGSSDKIFDPWPRRGGQIISNDNTITEYYASTATARGSDGNFHEAKFPGGSF